MCPHTYAARDPYSSLCTHALYDQQDFTQPRLQRAPQPSINYSAKLLADTVQALTRWLVRACVAACSVRGAGADRLPCADASKQILHRTL